MSKKMRSNNYSPDYIPAVKSDGATERRSDEGSAYAAGATTLAQERAAIMPKAPTAQAGITGRMPVPPAPPPVTEEDSRRGEAALLRAHRSESGIVGCDAALAELLIAYGHATRSAAGDVYISEQGRKFATQIGTKFAE